MARDAIRGSQQLTRWVEQKRKMTAGVLLDANPLLDISNTTKIAGVVLGGRWLSKSEIDRRLNEGGLNSGASSLPPKEFPPLHAVDFPAHTHQALPL